MKVISDCPVSICKRQLMRFLGMAEMAMGRIDQRLLFTAKIFDSLILLHCLRPCRHNFYTHANRISTPIPFFLVTCYLFSFYWFLASFLNLHYIISNAKNHVELCENVNELQHFHLIFDISDIILQSAGADSYQNLTKTIKLYKKHTYKHISGI